MKEQKEESFGIIPLTFRRNVWDVFIVQHLNGNHWGFPKGHREKGEGPKEAAERELLEETGMKVIRYLPLSYLIHHYQYQKKSGEQVAKSVRFYFAEVTPSYRIQGEELIGGKFIPIKELLSYVTFRGEEKFFQRVIETMNLSQ